MLVHWLNSELGPQTGELVMLVHWLNSELGPQTIGSNLALSSKQDVCPQTPTAAVRCSHLEQPVVLLVAWLESLIPPNVALPLEDLHR